jgi:hypothetical protein
MLTIDSEHLGASHIHAFPDVFTNQPVPKGINMRNKYFPFLTAGVLLLAGCTSSSPTVTNPSAAATTIDVAATTFSTATSGSTGVTVPTVVVATDPKVPPTEGVVIGSDPVVAPGNSGVPVTEQKTGGPTTEAPTEALTDVSVPPGASKDNFVGAASDVKTETCAADGDGWKASGTVTNSTAGDASYRIYVAFNVKDSTNTRGLVQTNIKVAAGKTEKWSAVTKSSDKTLICILNVERVAAP